MQPCAETLATAATWQGGSREPSAGPLWRIPGGKQRRQAEEAAMDIEECLEISTGGADPRGAYAILKLSSCVCAGAQPLPDGYGKVQGGLPEPLSEGGATHPWHDPGNTH